MPTPEEWHEADMLAEELAGGSVNYGSTEKALATLKSRLAYLQHRRELALQHDDDADALEASLRALDRDIADTQAKIREYELQRGGRN
jgi:hypothetical protein